MNQNAENSGEGSPFHAGERSVQERLGVREVEGWARKVVRDYLPEQHREFHMSQPFLIASARDVSGRPWATILTGPDGFVASPDSKHLVINAEPVPGDALETAFTIDADVGILGIELASRRRNRVNGRVASHDSGEITFQVDQSFGNCPQYIREREWVRVEQPPSAGSHRSGDLTPAQEAWIKAADTFFIASGFRGEGESPTYGMDVSHRGGERGFVRVLNSSRIQFPDYAGNNHYNTIGNLVLDSRAGLLFVDFASGSMLQLTGKASIDWDTQALEAFPGARRLVTLDIEEVVELPGAVNLRWDIDADSVRSLRLVEKIAESKDVTSFVFEARDGGALPIFEPGQHLPIEISIGGETARRAYSLSSGPHDERYRISVKREPHGLVSRHLHDNLQLGDIVSSRPPAGDFTMTCNVCPLVLVSAGVGVTPMVSILRAVSGNPERPVLFLHGARDGDHHPLGDEVRQLAAGKPNVDTHVVYSRPRPEDAVEKDYDSEGHVDGALLGKLVRDVGAHYFLCGPTRFMADIQGALEKHNVPSEQIHYETFGPTA